MDSQNVMHLESLNEVLPEEFHNRINELVNKCGTKRKSNIYTTNYP